MVRGRERLNVPSILTLLLGGFVAALSAIGLVFTLVPLLLELMQKLLELGGGHGPPPSPGMIRGILGYLLFTGSFILFGGWQMRVGKSFGLAVATAFTLMLPCCTSSCFVIGFPLGIWVLLVLFGRQVRDTFS